jgi:cytochrome c-type biogenesis protein CcmH/NrfG
MRKKFFLIVIPGLVIGVILALIVMAVSKPERPEAELLQTLKSDKGTFSDRNIQKAQGLIESQPKEPKGYNMLAAAFMQKARETGDFSLNALAEKSLEHSFRVAPDNYEAIKLYAAVLLNYYFIPLL